MEHKYNYRRLENNSRCIQKMALYVSGSILLLGSLASCGGASDTSAGAGTKDAIKLANSANASTSDSSPDKDKVEISFIHSGDFHGDLDPHDNAREGSDPDEQEGGLARVSTVIKKIRDKADYSVHVHTGDTMAGSAMASFTRGDALIRVVDQMGIDVFLPGNWEFSFGIYRYLQFFGNQDGSEITDPGDRIDEMAIPIPAEDQGMKISYGESFPVDQDDETRRWGAIASNAYINGTNHAEPGVGKGDDVGELLTKPYRIMEVGGVKIGFFGCTTNRGPQVVSSRITSGISFTNCKGEIRSPQNRPVSWGEATVAGKLNQDPTDPDNGFKVAPEIPKWVKYLREVEGVDIVAMLSEAGIAENIYNAENFDGIDLIFSSDMHEATSVPVVVSQPSDKWGSKTIIVEEGEDAGQVGELKIKIVDNMLKSWKWKLHKITSEIKEDEDIAELIKDIKAPFLKDDFVAGTFDNPYSNAVLMTPLDTVFGETEIELSRNRFSNEVCGDGQGCIDKDGFTIMPGVVGGSGHFLAVDVFRKVTGADVGGLRGFRYTNTILPGDDVTQDALYHYYPIGAMIAKGPIWTTPEFDNNTARVGGWPRNLVQEIELGANSSMNPLVIKWSGGWFWNHSGIHYNLDPEGPNFADSDIAVDGKYARISNLMLENPETGDFDVPLNTKEKIQYASYYYDNDPNRINRNQIRGKGPACVALEKAWRADERHDLSVEEGGDGVDLADRWQEYEDCLRGRGTDVGIQVLTKIKADGPFKGEYIMVSPWAFKNGIDSGEFTPLDAVEVMGRYLKEDSFTVYLPDGADADTDMDISHVVTGMGQKLKMDTFDFPRITLDTPLVDSTIEFGFPAIEPLRGAEGGITNGNVTVPAGYTIGIADAPADKGDF